MFRLSCDIKVEGYKAFSPSSAKWRSHVDDYASTGSFIVPAICALKTTQSIEYNLQTGMRFKEGQKVTISAGYDGVKKLRFSGFIARVNYSVPLNVELEGYSYQLRKKTGIKNSYKNTTVKNLLSDIIKGTDIKLSSKIPEIALSNIQFNGASGTDVLNWLKDKCLLTVFFQDNVLYVGLRDTFTISSAKFRINWNVIKANDLKFEDKTTATIQYNIEYRQKDGKMHKVTVGTNNALNTVTQKISSIQDDSLIQKIAKQNLSLKQYAGYEGKMEAFAEPMIASGETAVIMDKTYPDRTGNYFVDGVEGEISRRGGRQIILIGHKLNLTA